MREYCAPFFTLYFSKVVILILRKCEKAAQNNTKCFTVHIETENYLSIKKIYFTESQEEVRHRRKVSWDDVSN